MTKNKRNPPPQPIHLRKGGHGGLRYSFCKRFQVLLLLLRAENGVDCGTADRTRTFQSRFPILGGNPLGVFHIGLLFALDAIILICQFKVASLRHTSKDIQFQHWGQSHATGTLCIPLHAVVVALAWREPVQQMAQIAMGHFLIGAQ